ncbi:hypothetical protein CVU37_10245 [candidate division BRC1 bacterium HGW-BRC1-1]|jgi:uncharacterized protein YbjQ (UPF0145 family)|nr:MAG: hypothetical protein CVU37_10245 [candidate division BRC1 bacterium HGW-BRC1-1]
MIITTTPTIEGHRIVDYRGIVVGETIMGANLFRDLFAAVRDVVGGRSKAYEDVLSAGRDEAMAEMQRRAAALGANAIVGVDLDYEVVGKTGSMLMINVSGTAVVVE